MVKLQLGVHDCREPAIISATSEDPWPLTSKVRMYVLEVIEQRHHGAGRG
jgi:hypothetical protein